MIDQLVFEEGEADNTPVYSPGVSDKSDAYRQRYERCQKAFEQLSTFKERAFPYLVEHLDDKRASINFRNHDVRHSVGDACYWNIYFQLQDRPQDYSSYGYQRKGRDGKRHPKPYEEKGHKGVRHTYDRARSNVCLTPFCPPARSNVCLTPFCPPETESVSLTHRMTRMTRI